MRILFPRPLGLQRDRRLATIGILGLCFLAKVNGEIIPAGQGSYTTKRPSSCKALPDRIFRSPNLKGVTPTNQWWSSIVWQQYSNNLFPHPLAMRCQEGGLAVGYPGTAIVSNAEGIVGGGLGEVGDFIIGHSNVDAFPDATLAGNSDWFITVDFQTKEAGIKTSFGHGSPFVFCRHHGGSPSLTFAEKPVIWSGNESEAVIGLTVRGHHYGLFGATGSSWKGIDGTVLSLESRKDFFSIALLPDNSAGTLEEFARCAHNHVVDTRVVSKIERGHVRASYQFITEALQGRGNETFFSLYPHQWKYSEVQLSAFDYSSVRGTMRIAKGKGFETSVPIQGLLPMLPKEGIPDRERMLGYLKKEAEAKPIKFADTYWEGKHLGKLTSLSGIAESINEPELQEQFLAEIKTRLENWFTATPGEDSPLFYYNSLWGTLIGSVPSYGSDQELNDHHFHYGYFIRAAAEVARLDPEWARVWGPMVNLLIRDIASPSPRDPMFPRLRCFDLYAGHSWASGHANFGDGNNQESSSESLNAWYGMILWGEATGNDTIRDLGLFLHNTERTAVEEYWFDVSGTNFPENFPEVALGMIWGGKGAFATWFSGEIDHIHGINWLPFTPASISMGRFPSYVEKNHDRIVEVRKEGSDFNTGWGDLIVMFNALSNPKAAAAYIDEHPNCNIEGGNSHAFMYHWIHTLERLGLNDASVTADHPFVNVYTKDGKRTYAAYNFGIAPLKVHFSDGKVMSAKPGTLTTTR